ncbi:uncharacterized protein LOC127702679 [Mytilus californianus]|uniref:uncharacterized protein LOC127702679 n=1 Tax=Mytilus californianus TaxID=6549 RepID=UPI002244FD58|nr:uncharacterized protein LOC127702679 [Mytilus californianus]
MASPVTPALCHICEESMKIKWKCTNCNYLMCEKCKNNIHTKFPESEVHHVIELAKIGKKEINEPNLHILCKTHPELRIIFFCTRCQQLVCPFCVTNHHSGHEVESLKDLYKDKFNSLKYYRDELKIELSFHESSEISIETKINFENSLYESAKKALLDQAEKMKESVENESKIQLQKLEDRWKEIKDIQVAARNSSINAKQDLSTKVESLTLSLNSGNLKRLTETEDSIKTWTQPDKSYGDAHINSMKLDQGNINETQISDMFGILTDIQPDHKVKIEVLGSFDTDITVSNIQPCLDGAVMVSDYDTCLKMIAMGTDGIEQKNEIKDIDVVEMLEIDNEEVILSLEGKSKLVKMRNDGTILEFVDFPEMVPRALHLTKSCKIVIGICEKGQIELSENSVRQIIIMELNGDILHTYEFDDDKKRIFTYPLKATSHINNDMYVIDLQEPVSGQSRIISLAYPNKVMWMYKGDPNLTSHFKPRSLSVTSDGHIAVLDTQFLHVLNTIGTLKTRIDTRDYNIPNPISMCIDVSGKMWIGCRHRSYSVYLFGSKQIVSPGNHILLVDFLGF